jgi:hypothetical protein
MISLTTSLIDYWHRLPLSPVVERRLRLENARRRVRANELARAALVPYALADDDEEVVYTATREFVTAGPGADGGATALDDTLQWIRRHLALNRGAVFAALLSLGDESVNERLAGLRLTLRADEVATVCKRAAPERCGHTRTFLAHWLELLTAGAPRAESEIVAAALRRTGAARAA